MEKRLKELEMMVNDLIESNNTLVELNTILTARIDCIEADEYEEAEDIVIH